MDFLKKTEKSRIIFALSLLKEKIDSGYNLESINIKNDTIVFSNGEKEEKISIKKIMEEVNNGEIETDKINQINETDSQKNLELNTTEKMVNEIRNEPIKDTIVDTSVSASQVGGYGRNINFSETSEMYEISEMSEMSEMPNMGNKITGGANIFQKSKYSETSSLKHTDISNYSATSSLTFNGRSDKYSDTSVLGQLGGKAENLTSDTLGVVSELKQRKVSKNTKQVPKLDMGIFTKKSQSGGAVENIKRKMMDIGINSNSSTSSICE